MSTFTHSKGTVVAEMNDNFYPHTINYDSNVSPRTYQSGFLLYLFKKHIIKTVSGT